MLLQTILQAKPGSSQLMVTAPGELETQLRTMDRQTGDFIEVRFVRGPKMRTKAATLNELAAALQFFNGFGDNWDALRDALSSMQLLNTGSLLVCVWDAEQTLGEQPTELATLAKIIKQVKADLVAKKSVHSLQWLWQVDSESRAEAIRADWEKIGLLS